MAAIVTPDRPFHLSWDLTAACGLHCRFCYSDVGQSASEESKELVDLALDNIIEMRPLHLGIGGGDPLLSPFLAYALEQLVDRLGNAMPVVTIDTMMLGRKPEAARLVRNLNEYFDEEKIGFYLSIHGIGDLHDEIVGVKGHFEEQLYTVTLLKEVGVSFGVGMVPTKANYHQIDAVLALALGFKAKLFNVSQFVPAGRGKIFQDQNLSREEYRWLVDWVVRANQRLGHRYVVTHEHWLAHVDPELGHSDLFIGCSAGTYYIGLRSNGDVVPCQLSSYVLGNIRRDRLSHIWANNQYLLAWRRRQVTGRCQSCPLLYKCGGCRCNAVAYGHGFLGEDPLCPYNDQELQAQPIPAPEARAYQKLVQLPDDDDIGVVRRQWPSAVLGDALVIRCDVQNAYIRLTDSARTLYEVIPSDGPLSLHALKAAYRARTGADMCPDDLEDLIREGVVECVN